MMIDEAEKERRRNALNFARGSVQLEGGDISPEAEAISKRYIEGELTVDEFIEAIKSM